MVFTDTSSFCVESKRGVCNVSVDNTGVNNGDERLLTTLCFTSSIHVVSPVNMHMYNVYY